MITDQTGEERLDHYQCLQRAYASPSNTFIHHGVLYIAGSHEAHDWYHDDAILPLRMVRHTARYREAREAMHNSDERIRKFVGHSLGAAVADALASDYGGDKDLYAPPHMTMEAGEHSHRHWWDPISLFSRGGDTTRGTEWNPHAYDNARGRFD